jgi:hypothetical protein
MGRLRAGAHKKDITPPPGTDLYGYIRRFGSSKGAHDQLLANFLSIDDGVHQALLISLDILFINSEFSDKIKESISKELKIKKKNILIACVHTHSAPGIHLFRNCGERDKNWEEKLSEELVRGASQSIEKQKKAEVGAGTGFALIGKNRRKQGGPVDPYFPLLCFRDEKDIPFAAVANLGCHPVVLDERNLLFSADYIGYFRDYLSKFLCSEVITLFFTGASGDVNPLSQGSFAIADRLGKILAEEAIKVIKKMEFRKSIAFKAREKSLNIPYQWIPSRNEAEKIYEQSLDDYDQALRKGEKEEIKIRRAFLLWAEEIREKAAKGELPSALECELQCLKIGDAVFLVFPFELFSSVSLSLRARSQIENLFVAGYANGYGGYLLDERSYAEGGYEAQEAFKYCGLLPLPSLAEKLFLKKALSLLKNI